jgi:hypothetical protein
MEFDLLFEAVARHETSRCLDARLEQAGRAPRRLIGARRRHPPSSHWHKRRRRRILYGNPEPSLCLPAGATSYRRVMTRDSGGAVLAAKLYQCSGCSLVFADPSAWRGGAVQMRHWLRRRFTR